VRKQTNKQTKQKQKNTPMMIKTTTTPPPKPHAHALDPLDDRPGHRTLPAEPAVGAKSGCGRRIAHERQQRTWRRRLGRQLQQPLKQRLGQRQQPLGEVARRRLHSAQKKTEEWRANTTQRE
jgi:hypothetical protein